MNQLDTVAKIDVQDGDLLILRLAEGYHADPMRNMICERFINHFKDRGIDVKILMLEHGNNFEHIDKDDLIKIVGEAISCLTTEELSQIGCTRIPLNP